MRRECTRIVSTVVVPMFTNVLAGPVPDEAPWVCELCPPESRRCCTTRKGLTAHAYKAHGYQTPARLYVHSATCPVCLKLFTSRTAAINHLGHRASRCKAQLGTLVPLSAAQLADIELADKLGGPPPTRG